MNLIPENYHSLEANQAYLSYSQYKDFRKCEAMAMAKLSGWREEPSIDMLVGSYVHAWCEGTLDKFKQDTPEMFKKDGTPYSQFVAADQMIASLANDDFITLVLAGAKEVIMTGKFAAVDWKIKMDVYTPDKGRFVDLKTMRSLDKVWVNGVGYQSMVEAYGYLGQLALYAEIERVNAKRDEHLETYIVAVTKEDPPDKAIISTFDPDRTAYELDVIASNIPRILQVKSGIEEPFRCDHCRFCRETKQVSRVIHYSLLID